MNYEVNKICTVNIPELLNKKFLEWQLQSNQRKTVKEFADVFGISPGLMTMWMNGDRSPGPEYKKRIVEMYGDEAIVAFGEDPDLYKVNANWEFMTPEARRTFREQSEKYRTENESKSKGLANR